MGKEGWLEMRSNQGGQGQKGSQAKKLEKKENLAKGRLKMMALEGEILSESFWLCSMPKTRRFS